MPSYVPPRPPRPKGGYTRRSNRRLQGPLLTRSFDTEVRALAVEKGRTVTGLAAPFNVEAPIRNASGVDQWECIVPGAFTRTIKERGHQVRLHVQHDLHAFPIGRASKLWETREGLQAEFLVAKTAAGDEALELITTGTVTGLSMGVNVIKERVGKATDGKELRMLTELKLWEISLVTWPAYENAGVTATRTLLPVLPVSLAERRLALALKRF